MNEESIKENSFQSKQDHSRKIKKRKQTDKEGMPSSGTETLAT